MPEDENELSSEVQAALETMRREVMSELPDRVEVISPSDAVTVPTRETQPPFPPEAPALTRETIARLDALTQSEPQASWEQRPPRLDEVLMPAPLSTVIQIQRRPQSSEFGFLTDVRVPGIGRILEGQQELAVRWGEPAGEPSVKVPTTPAEQAKSAWIEEDGRKTEVVPGETKRERLACGGDLFVMIRIEMTCDVTVGGFTTTSFEAPQNYRHDADAQAHSDLLFPDSLELSTGALNRILEKDVAQWTSAESATLNAWLEACTCVQDALKADGKWGTVNDSDGNEIPAPPPAINADIECDPPCVKVWRHWCCGAQFSEIARWSEVTGSRLSKGPMPQMEYDVAIKVRVKGWVQLCWHITCEELINTSEGQELVTEGAMTPDGTPIGHYRPPWEAPPPEPPPPPEDCCCEIVSVNIVNIQQCRFRGDLWGHVFDVEIVYKWVKGVPEDCVMQWWEWSDNFPPWYKSRYGIKDGQWVDIADKIKNSPVFDPWKKRPVPRTSDECDGQQHILVLRDIPALGTDASKSENLHRTLWIKIRAAGCAPTEDSACFVQHLNQTSDGIKHSVEAFAYECADSLPADQSVEGDFGPPAKNDSEKLHRTGYDDALPAVECTLF